MNDTMRALLSVLALCALLPAGAFAEESQSFEAIPPLNVPYRGQAVGSVASPLQTVTWDEDLLWATDEGVYRRRPGGHLQRYDLMELAGQVMGHALGVAPQQEVSRKVWNLVVRGRECWIASETFGVFRFRPETEQWTRYDIASRAANGRRLWIAYADPAYVFVVAAHAPGVSALSVFSDHRQRWINLERLPARLVTRVGASPNEAWIAAPIDYRLSVREDVFTVPPSLSAVISAEGTTYVYHDDTTQPKTRVELPVEWIEAQFARR